MISIIIPVYNVAEYLEKCIESVLCQSYSDLEIILVDDGSTDESGKICDEYQKKDARIKVIHKKNGGLSDARNTGLEQANGDYVAFLDSDDIVHPKMYEYLLEFLEEQGADIAACGITRNETEIFGEDDFRNVKQYVYTQTQALTDIRYILISSCNKLYRKNIWKDLCFPVGKYHEDEFVFHHTIGKAAKIVATDIKMYYYVQREGSITYQLSQKRIADAIEALEDRMIYTEKYADKQLTEAMVHKLLQYLMRVSRELTETKSTELCDIKTLQEKGKQWIEKYGNISLEKDEKIFIQSRTGYVLYIKYTGAKEKLRTGLRFLKYKWFG